MKTEFRPGTTIKSPDATEAQGKIIDYDREGFYTVKLYDREGIQVVHEDDMVLAYPCARCGKDTSTAPGRSYFGTVGPFCSTACRDHHTTEAPKETA